jgi:solute carrier family 4 (sodium borate transporter), member 11
VRETRVTGILSHVLIGLSVFYIQQLQLIPRPVLDGLFLYLAMTALHSNQLFERIMLLVTEQVCKLWVLYAVVSLRRWLKAYI